MISKKKIHSTLFWSSFVKKELQSPKMFYLPTKLVYGTKQINKIKMKTDMTIWPPKHLRNRKDQVVWNHTIRFYFWINWWIKMYHFWYSLNGINMNLGQAGAQHKTHRAWKQSPKSKIKPPTAWNQVNICKESSLVKICACLVITFYIFVTEVKKPIHIFMRFKIVPYKHWSNSLVQILECITFKTRVAL